MRNVSLFLMIFLCFPVYATVDVHFTPSSKCENLIVNMINNSKKTIDAAVYSINNKQIVAALKNAHDRGVKLRILTDKLQASSKYSKVKDLYLYGVGIKVNSKYKIEHNKFAVFDGNKVSTGSFNWTNNASKSNSENCLFVYRDKKTIKAYKKRFNELWKINSAEKSEAWFEKNKVYKTK